MKNNSPELNLRVGRDQINGTHHPQEDSYDCGETPYGYFYVLADGMGGYGGGDIASQTVVEAFAASMAKGDSLGEALVVANKALDKVKKRKNLPQGAGCTLVAVTVDLSKDGVSCSFLSVGDSYIYYCPAGASMQQVNPLHENEDGSLYSALQGGEIEAVFTAVNALQLYPGDRLMLASDGVQAFGENKLRSLFRKYPVPPMQNQDADVIPGEAGDLVYRILHRLEEDTELGLRQDPEYYQDNASVMIVEWAPDSQEKPRQGRPVEVKPPFVLTRERGVMLGIIMCLVLALCFVLWPNSGEVNKTVQNSASVSQPAPHPRTDMSQQEKSAGVGVTPPENVQKFEEELTADKVDYNAIVNAWAGLSDDQKQLKLGDLKTWFYGKVGEENFDRLMTRCQELAKLNGNSPQADGMLAYLLEKDDQGIEALIPDSITKNKLSLNPDTDNDVIPHFRLLDLWLATKVNSDSVSEGEWLNWFIYEITGLSGSLKSKLEKLQGEVRTKALEVDPEKLLAAYNKKGSASKRNVKALLENPSFVGSYSDKQEEWIKKKFNDNAAKAFCEPLMRFLIQKYENNGAELRGLGMTVEKLITLEKEGCDFTAAKTALAAANLEFALDELKNKVSEEALTMVEKAYGVAKDNGVAGFDEKVSTKVAELITKGNFTNEIYKNDRYLKPIWTNLLTRLVTEIVTKKEDIAGKLKKLGLDVDKICKLLDEKNDNGDLKAAFKTLIAEQMPKAEYAAFKNLYSIAKERIDAGFAEELVWQFFTTGEKLNATKVTEYAKDGRKAAALMDVLIEQLTEKKKGDGKAPIKVTDLMDYSQVVWVDFETGWGNGPVPDSWKLYRYILYMIPSGILGDIEEKERNAGKTVNAKKEENRQTLSGAINNSKYAKFKDRLTDKDKKTEN